MTSLKTAAKETSHFSALFVTSPLGRFLSSQLISYSSIKNVGETRAMFILSQNGTKLGQNLSKMEVKTFATINKVIWDQLLAS